MRHRTRVAVVALLLAGCSGGPSTPELPLLALEIGSGDGQFGTAGQILPQRLQVVVTTASSGAPRKELGVLWTVESGDASLTTSAATLTDEMGAAYATIRLGSTPGEVRVRATVTEQEAASAVFVLQLVDRPVLESLSASAAAAGETITLSGSNFSPTAEHDIVLFSGIQGRVLSASPTQLSVEVPTCLPTRTVDVTVQLGTVASSPLSLAVTGGSEVLTLDPGQEHDLDSGLPCVRLPAGASYLVLVESTSTIAGAQHEFTLRGLGGDAGKLSRSREREASSKGGIRVGQQDRFEDGLRLRESRLVRSWAPRTGPRPALSPAAVPQVGERRTFSVFNKDSEFDQVTAVARYVGARAALFVEEGTGTGFSESDLAAFAERFDDVIHPTVSATFGNPSDLDGNERVVILFTATVNRITPKGSNGGFVGGFFFGLDLLPGRDNSNGGEVFYTIVPDPNGAYSDPRPIEKLQEVVPAILAHEYQHMVHFNERVLVLEAENTEALWLSEGLAQMAEELVARAYEADGDAISAELFRGGNQSRAKRYLSAPSEVSLIVRGGQGTLAERGGGWLHVLYLTQRDGATALGGGVLGRLVRSTRTGVENVTHQMGVDWASLLSDWWSALYLDDMTVGPRLEFPDIGLRDLLGDAYTLVPEALGGDDFTRSGELWSSSARYYIVEPASQGSLTLRLGGQAGGASPDGAALRLRLVRLP